MLALLAAASTAAPPPQSVVVVGGSSGMGKALATAVVARGGRVLLASRSREKLNAARTEIVSSTGCVDVLSVETYCLDASDEAAVADFAASLPAGAYDGLVVSSAGAAPHGAITSLPTADTQSLFGSKFWAAYFACKHVGPRLADGGAIALVGGVLNRRPGINCVPLATVNGALEGLTCAGRASRTVVHPLGGRPTQLRRAPSAAAALWAGAASRSSLALGCASTASRPAFATRSASTEWIRSARCAGHPPRPPTAAPPPRLRARPATLWIGVASLPP
eukprot:3243288-Prymnesium_polylepis.1